MWNLQWCLTDNKYTSWWENCSTFKYAHSWINVQWKDASELLAVQIVFVHKQMQIVLLRRLLNKYKGQKHSRARRTMDFCKHIQTRNVLVQCHISASHMPTRLTTHVELLSQRLIPQPIGKGASSGSASNIAFKTATLASRISPPTLQGFSIATRVTICSKWFWMTSRMMP